ncbi:bifunctional 4-hydroxy-2-oxoglutarate aldolase/2-dehydro-3-deoxy-phosphogluconate aldolase [Shumkonia mesophila]|uniref:bifunctional 4-hydroxy-2-oxoglutarate aldolase/2-dehydro-3-deoxy-phosphogluconate aldolase n=1 Tax=Shumkonia mesophila TaxID=2838854 RepID=UPI002934EC85|nr:bifunctional 4-hydroxy-2-oxoglutarate aldolase/2-dehydro-3-deoxy-phosphogluconate aldolase [Shumkonia mesophila]
MSDIYQKFHDLGIIPVVAINDAKHAVPLAKALVAGGLPVAEITFRTDAAEESIKRIAKEVPEVMLGAGTVLTVEQAKRAVAAGANYIISPGIEPKVVGWCVENNIPVTPGVACPSDIAMALSFGLEVVKFFPAENIGGLPAMKAIAGPYGMIKFIPTGGISAANLNTYLAYDKVLACGGSWMVKSELIAAEKFGEIERLTREAVLSMLGFGLAHVGINTKDDGESLSVAKKLGGLFALPVKEGNSSNFAGTIAEVMKGKGPGTNGHIAIATNDIERAMAFLRRSGVEFDMASAKGPEGGSIKALYLKEEIAGFGVHLLRR